MKQGLTKLVFILDRSGSMSGLEGDTIGGFNSLLDKQKKEPGDCTVTTVLFDDRYELLHDRIPLGGVERITEREYYVRGSTALLDALGRTIDKTANAQTRTAESERAEKVLFVIITDGMENASREYGIDRVKAMVEQKQKESGWEFLFLGANIDAIQVAARFGIAADRAVNYCPDGAGTRLNYDVVSATVAGVRAGRPMAANWKRRIEEDYQTRKGKGRK
ncbi:MAG: VWA domain-containing protein [Clostridiales bacterium]|nr:VWA domain-containing protein [Clostridiales bacterium]